MSDSSQRTPITYTVKAGKEFDKAWAVFNGDADTIRRSAMEFFGIPEDQVEGLPAANVLQLAEKYMRGEAAVMGTLGGTPTKLETTTGAWGSEQQDDAAGSQQHATGGDADPAAEKRAKLLDAVDAAQSIQELKQLWAKNKDAFNEPELMDAYKAKGKALS